MDWMDTGIVLSARAHGESYAIVTLLTEHHGRHAGLIRTSKKTAALLQIGTYVRADWRGRLSEHLGFWTLEPLKITCANLLDRPQALLALSAGCSLIDLVLPDHEAHPLLYRKFLNLLEKLEKPAWQKSYVIFEICMLRELGFGLDLSRCAATGVTDNLMYISPKTGRAVSQEGGKDYAERLLPLPSFIIDLEAEVTPQDFKAGLRLTSYFLERYALEPSNRKMPSARVRLSEGIST
ncbi:MAG: DNA repair protein RecO [Alphaproteobacteria bacterium]|nr:DNA repair protein RecO [Alphaproteobacteria bacterium]